MLQARPDLFCARRSEYGAGDTSGEETVADETSESWFMSRTTAADEGNVVRRGKRRGISIHDLVGLIKQKRWIGQREGVERGSDGMDGISEVVLCCWGK